MDWDFRSCKIEEHNLGTLAFGEDSSLVIGDNTSINNYNIRFNERCCSYNFKGSFILIEGDCQFSNVIFSSQNENSIIYSKFFGIGYGEVTFSNCSFTNLCYSSDVKLFGELYICSFSSEILCSGFCCFRHSISSYKSVSYDSKIIFEGGKFENCRENMDMERVYI